LHLFGVLLTTSLEDKMSWTEPLNLQVIFFNIFSGSSEIFGAIAILFITTMAGYFRMNGISMFLMIGIFILMFSGYIGINFLILFAIFGGLIIGYTLSKILQ
jgi:hypothetical protein